MSIIVHFHNQCTTTFYLPQNSQCTHSDYKYERRRVERTKKKSTSSSSHFLSHCLISVLLLYFYALHYNIWYFVWCPSFLSEWMPTTYLIFNFIYILLYTQSYMNENNIICVYSLNTVTYTDTRTLKSWAKITWKKKFMFEIF